MMKNTWDAVSRQTSHVKFDAYFSGMVFNSFRESGLIVET
jgi:hypothetical protein